MSTHDFPRMRVQLVAPDTTELWIDMTPYIKTLGVSGFLGRIIVTDKTGSFSCRVGIQTEVARQDRQIIVIVPAL